MSVLVATDERTNLVCLLSFGASSSKLAHAKRVLCIMAVEGGEAGGSQVWTSSVDQTIKIWKAKVRAIRVFHLTTCGDLTPIT